MNPNIVISDLDGTIAFCEHRRHWLDKEQHPELSPDERWRRFFAECAKDSPNLPVITRLQDLAKDGFRIEIFSARSDEVRPQTLEWLRKHGLIHGVHYQRLRMREAGDFTPDEILKRSWIEEYDLSKIECVFDDRPKVIRMWRDLGLEVIDCGDGVEF